MKRYEKVIAILDTAVGGNNIGRHGAFWRGLTLETFKQRNVMGLPLILPGDGANSNIILALRGQFPFGEDIGTLGARYPQMPVGYPPVPEDRIAFIEQWISDGCPDDDIPA